MSFRSSDTPLLSEEYESSTTCCWPTLPVKDNYKSVVISALIVGISLSFAEIIFTIALQWARVELNDGPYSIVGFSAGQFIPLLAIPFILISILSIPQLNLRSSVNILWILTQFLLAFSIFLASASWSIPYRLSLLFLCNTSRAFISGRTATRLRGPME